jgi:hypothetical protein
LFSQITRTTPLRRTILHLGQIFFADALTFMEIVSFWPPSRRPAQAGGLFGPVHNAPAREIVGRQLQGHFVPRQNLDEMHTHFSGDVSQDAVLVFKLHLEHGIRQGFQHDTLNPNGFFFRHASLLP